MGLVYIRQQVFITVLAGVDVKPGKLTVKQAHLFDSNMTEAISHDQHEKPAAAPLAHGNKVDAAFEFLDVENASVTEVDEKQLLSKIDWRIVPLMCK